MHVIDSPYFHKFINSLPYIHKCFLNFPLIFVQFTFFGLIIDVFCFPPIFTMMHLCIMLYAYWTPLDIQTVVLSGIVRASMFARRSCLQLPEIYFTSALIPKVKSIDFCPSLLPHTSVVPVVR